MTTQTAPASIQPNNPLLPPLLEDVTATNNVIKAKAYFHKLKAARFPVEFRIKQVWKIYGIRVIKAMNF